MAKYLYHKAPIFVRQSILNNGLKPSVGASYKAHWEDREDLIPYVFLYDYDMIGEYDSTYDDDIYRVDMSMLDKNHLFLDPDEEMEGCYVYDEIIPTTAIELIYEGSNADSGDLSKHSNIY